MGSHRFLRALFAALFALTIAGCGGGGASGGFGGDPTDPTDPTDPGAPRASALTVLLPAGNQLPADADTIEESLLIEVIALDPGNNTMANVPIAFSASSGELAVGAGTTGPDGRASARLTTASNSTPRDITITARSGDASATAIVTVVPPTNNTPRPRLGLILNNGDFSLGTLGIAVSPLGPGASSELTVNVVDVANNNVVFTDPVSVTFSSSCISSGTASVTPNPATAQNGVIRAVYTALGCSGSDVVTAQAFLDGANRAAQGTISVQPVNLTISLPAGNQLPSDADTPAEGLPIAVIATDAASNSLVGVPVNFSADSGEITVVNRVTGADGRASATLTTAGSSTPRNITVRASVGSTLVSAIVTVVPPSNQTPDPRLGLIQTDGSFAEGVIEIGTTPVAAGGSSQVRVNVVDVANNNSLITSPTQITFSSPCLTAGTATIAPNPVSSANGTATATYTAQGCSGTDPLTASAFIGGADRVAVGNVTTQQVNLTLTLPEGNQLPSDADTVAEGLILSALAIDGANNALVGIPVKFSVDSGEVIVTNGNTGSDGRATAVVTTASSSALRTIIATATVGTATASVAINVVAPSNQTPDPRLGFIMNDGSFSQGVVGIGTNPVPAGGSSVLRVHVVDIANNNALVTTATPISFSSACLSAGTATISPNPATTQNGLATVTYSSRGCSGADVVTAEIFIGGQDRTAQGTVNTQPVRLTLTLPGGNELPADADTVPEGLAVVAIAVDAFNNALSGIPVDFAADTGEIAVTQRITGSDGRANAVLTTASDATLRTITVSGSVGTASASALVTVVPPTNNNPPLPRLGFVDGSGTFNSGLIEIGLSSVPAGGSSGLRLDIVDVANGNAIFLDPVSVTFTSLCIRAGTSSVNPNPATSFGGGLTATYVASGCSGDDQITALATAGGQSLQATGTINVLSAELGSIEFVSATPANVGLQGSGRPETSTIVFRVRNSVGGVTAGQLVDFALNTDVGGITLSPPSGITDPQGLVQTVVRAGTVATTVRVTATASQGGSIVSSQSEVLTITTGLPDQDSFSLSAETLNAEGLNRDGTQVLVTIRAADRFNNPVTDGTAVNFRTEGGDIVGSCTTDAGVCSVLWESQNPRPSNGRSTIFAYALGEESFIDEDGDGLYDPGLPEFFVDLSEAFRDDNENGVRDPGEEFIDLNSDFEYTSADVRFNGLLCDQSPPGSPPDLVQCGTLTSAPMTINVRDSLVLVMSGSSAVLDPGTDVAVVGATYDPVTRTIVVPNAGSFSLTTIVRDVNDQPMASGTSIEYSVTGGGQLLGSSSFVVPATNNPSAAANTYGIIYKAPELEVGDPPNITVLELKVTSPESELTTTLQFTVLTTPP